MLRRRMAIAGVAALCGLSFSASPIRAYKWPGTEPSIGGVVAAKVIGQKCSGVLSQDDMAELDIYLRRAVSEENEQIKAASQKKIWFSVEESVSRFTATYTKKYSGDGACNVDASEEARDMLSRVRSQAASGRPVLTATNLVGKPDLGEAMSAKVTGEQCPGTLTGLEQAELELIIATHYVRFARSSSDQDAVSMIRFYKQIEVDLASGYGGWFDRTRGCDAAAKKAAKDIAARATQTDQ